ncbi:MAG: hypothetical protein ACI8VI_001622 [Granulosicoccus sp.]
MTELCEAFNLNVSSYYYKSIPPNLTDINLLTMIKSISNEFRNNYGKRRVQAGLNGLGHLIGLHKTASLMVKANIVGLPLQSLMILPLWHNRKGSECFLAIVYSDSIILIFIELSFYNKLQFGQGGVD